MKRFLGATALSVVLSLSAAGASANSGKMHKEPDSAVIKASYALPKEDGDAFRQTMHEADEENLNLKQQVALGHADMYDLLTAPDFDRNAFVARAGDVHKLEEQMHDNRADAFAAAAEQLTADERVTLANTIESGMTPHKTAHHSHKKADSDGNSSSDNSSAVSQ